MNSVSTLKPPYWLTTKNDDALQSFVVDVFAGDSSQTGQLTKFLSDRAITIDKVSRSESPFRREWHITASAQQAWDLFQDLIPLGTAQGFDVAVTPATAKIRLLVCDMDSTIVSSETLDDIADRAGLGDSVKQITARAMRGELDFKQALRQRVSLLKGLNDALLHEVAADIRFSDGAETLISMAKQEGIRTVLVSGGFEPIVGYAGSQLGFDRYLCNQMELIDNIMSGRVLMPIVDAELKLQTLVEECQAMKIDTSQACSIGDGANDLPMLKAAGLGISYDGKPLLRSAIPYQINVTDLTTVLPLLGIR